MDKLLTPLMFAIFAAAFIVVWAKGNSRAGLVIGIGYLFGATAFAVELLAAATAGPDERSFLPDILYVATPSMIAMGVLLHFEQDAKFKWFASLLAAFVLCQGWFFFVEPDPVIRSALASGAAALVLVAPIYFIMGLGSAGARWISAALAGSGLFFMANAVAVLTVMNKDMGQKALSDTVFGQVTFFGTAVCSVALASMLLISLIWKQLRAVEALSTRDAMTGLLNRRGLEQALPEKLNTGGEHSLISVDVDHFKRINDQFGHSAGDEVLKEVVRRLEGCQRSSDIVARLGGEEFCAILPGAPVEVAKLLAEQIRMSIEISPIAATSNDGKSQSLNVTASFGVTGFAGPDDFSSALRRSDQALYDAKDGGRNRVCVRPAAKGGQLGQQAVNVVRLRG